MKPISFWRRLADLVAPRFCVACDRRLQAGEETLCTHCHLHLPRTGFQHDAHGNEMAKLFWGQVRIDRAAALFYYEPHAKAANIIYALKYRDRPEVGVQLGRQAARELLPSGFFDGIDGIVPVPLTARRQRERGYNQSREIARGISQATGLPVYDRALSRLTFRDSQTAKRRWERHENVEHAFGLRNAAAARGRHLLIVDDVVTTGATVTACARELHKAGGVTLSVLALGFSKS